MLYVSHADSPFLLALRDDARFANLKAFVERMRAKYWKDWDNKCAKK